jgi:hypothetical protein
MRTALGAGALQTTADDIAKAILEEESGGGLPRSRQQQRGSGAARRPAHQHCHVTQMASANQSAPLFEPVAAAVSRSARAGKAEAASSEQQGARR